MDAPGYSLAQLTRYFLGLGSVGFGGPVALVGYMHRDLVETRGWISAEDYKEGLALAQLMPGPLAAQLAMYLGYVHYRLIGATVIGTAFVLPSFVMVIVIGWGYVRYGGLAWMQAVFYGVGASVIGIIAISACKLTAKNIGRDKLLWAVYVVSVTATVWTQSESVWLFVGAGVLVWLVRAPPKRGFGSSAAPALTLCSTQWTTGCALGSVLDWNLLLEIGAFFAKAGAFVFGSGLAIVPFLYAGVVHEHQWLTERQFVDAVAVAMITPGPVVITVGFIGYLIAGITGAIVAAIGTFLPCYLFTVLPAPYFKKYGKLPALVAFVNGVTAAAIGAITGAVIVLAERSIVDVITALIALVTIGLIWKVRKIPEPALVAAAAIAGLLLFHDVNGAAMADMTNFDRDVPGTLPAGWVGGVTGHGTPKWTVEVDSTAPSPPNVLRQSGSGTFPWCVRKDVSVADGSVHVRFKPISGREDQAGGLVWRWKDGDNYYVARANALENNVSLYYTQNGRRNTIKYVDAPVTRNEWHTLSVNFTGTRIQVALDGRTYIDAEDRHISGAGAVGVWTKADSVTAFDDFSYTSAGKP